MNNTTAETQEENQSYGVTEAKEKVPPRGLVL